MNTRIWSTAILLLLVLASSVCSQNQPRNVTIEDAGKITDGLRITYIANEGVLIEADNKTVMIDGLHRYYKDAYAYPPDSLKNKLEYGKAPYDKIDLVLVSHLHGDHFHPESVGNHLVNNPGAKLASSTQIVEEVRKNFDDFNKIKTRIVPVEHEWKNSLQKDFDGIKVDFLGLRHGSERFKWIQNLGHVIEIAGKRFLHIGDADMNRENFSSFKIGERNIDVAFIPFWFLLSKNGRDLVKEQFDPKHIIAVHVSPADAASVSKELKRHYPEITVFTKILETKTF